MKKVKNLCFTRMPKNISLASILLSMSFFLISFFKCYPTELFSLGIHVIPYPQEVALGGGDFEFKNQLSIILDQDFSASDKFTADELIKNMYGKC